MATRGRVLSTIRIGMNCAKLDNKELNVLTEEEFKTLQKLYSKDVERVDFRMQQVLNEMSLAEREAFAQKQAGIILRPPKE